MENELGGVSLDSKEVSGGKTDVLEFMEGCVCCTMKDSFVNSVLTVSATLDPEFLVIEPTGAAELGSLLNSLKKICYEKITLADPLTIVSPSAFFDNMNACGGIFTDQIRSAPKILLSKTEAADEAEIAAVCREINEINPNAEVVTEHYTKKPDEWWESLFHTHCGEQGQKIPLRPQPSGLEEFTAKERGFDNPAELIELLRGILWGYYGGVIRAKGTVKCGAEWVRFDLADRAYGIVGAGADCAEQQCVFIGKGINSEKILSRFKPQSN